MKLRYLLLLSVVLVGCEGEPPKPPSPPKDMVYLKPGPSDADAPTEFTQTESGLKYKILRKSEGKKPTADDTVRVHYRGTFDDGKIFDTSYGRTGSSVSFPLKGVIKGWTEGLQLIGSGGMIELEIPPDLAYGKEGRGGMPPNATLHFIVELLEVKDATAQGGSPGASAPQK